MPQAETAAPAFHSLSPTRAVVRGWGGGPGAAVSLISPADVDQLRDCLRESGRRAAIARGMGRSYGDAAQLADGLVLDITRLKGFQLDRERGVVTAGAGVTLSEVLSATVPAGWIVPVVPGTQHVTVGGAIASDIHGKNHGSAGTLGSHVEALRLLTADGEVLDLIPGDELFGATLGGMGLTGVILSAQIKLRAVSSGLLSVDTDRVEDLDQALAALSVSGGAHRVAWLDLLCSRPGRGVVTRAEHLGGGSGGTDIGGGGGSDGKATVSSRATVPAHWPGAILRPNAVRAFNEIRFRRSPRRQREHVESFGSHMFPLDALDAWPRLYGRRGFLQYQLVVPPGAEHVLSAVIEGLRRSRVPCYLCVLKDFGPANDAPLSFPIEGWTIALDIPRAAPGLYPLLDHFDELVAEAGGRVYLSKDARMRPRALASMYPRLSEWREVRDRADPEGRWRSDLALRAGLVGE